MTGNPFQVTGLTLAQQTCPRCGRQHDMTFTLRQGELRTNCPVTGDRVTFTLVQDDTIGRIS